MDCRARLEDGRLTIENSRIRRGFAWNDGNLRAVSLENRLAGDVWALGGDQPDFALYGKAAAAAAASLDVAEMSASTRTPEHLRVTVEMRLETFSLKRVFRIYPDCPAIACDYYYRGSLPEAPAAPAGVSGAAADQANIEHRSALQAGVRRQTVVSRVCAPGRHWRFTAVEFNDVTDRCNNLVREEQALAYLQPWFLTGNLLFAEETMANRGFFLLKEAPCSSVQLHWPGSDFMVRIGEVQVWGAGIGAGDVGGDGWTRGYGVVTGVFAGGECGRLTALREYQRRLRVAKPGRDHMVLLNTWGDRGQDKRIREEFAMAELAAGARLGVSHFQLDDGWQAGQTSNSASPGGRLSGIWDRPGFWEPHPERFPRGLGPVAAKARELGIELCIWFNPSADDGYAHWQDDAGVLTGLHRAHGIRTFKIDGVKIPDKRAEENLRRMFEAVMAATGGNAVFNLDVTAGRRYGYHYFNEYGNIFVENRYTDWGNYFPHWTLRNLWMLARFVPPQSLQVEFLNKWRNPQVYGDDPLAPGRMSFEYVFAVAMTAQPLAWFEASGLPEEAFATAALVRLYRQHQEELHAGMILPLGNEPDGMAWTGFQSILDSASGHVLIFREGHPDGAARPRLWGQAGNRLAFTPLAGAGRAFTAVAGADGGVEFCLPEKFSFAWFRYSRQVQQTS